MSEPPPEPAGLFPATEARAAAAGGAAPLQGPVQGVIERVTYHHPESLYTVLKIGPEKGYGDPAAPASVFAVRVTGVGTTPAPGEGLRVRLHGEWVVHRTHGRQFAFERLETLPPIDPEGLVRYLASKAFAGIGETLARRIVEALGTDALTIIRDRPERLREVRGLRPDVAGRLQEALADEQASHELFAFLLGLGLGPWQAEAVARAYGRDATRRVREDPYRLARDVRGIGFLTADRVAAALGFAPDCLERRCAALLHVLDDAGGDGHSLLPAGRLVAATGVLLRDEIGAQPLREALAALARAREVVLEQDARLLAPPENATGNEADDPDASTPVYLPMIHTCEVGLARHLEALHRAAPLSALADEPRLLAAERLAGIELHPDQRHAVLGLLSHPLALLTGGPGVGKTTIVRLVVELAEQTGARVKLASPTGRAAKRLAEATGREASTIHRLLGFEPRGNDGAGGRFQHDERKPLEADLVVVDEISMLDVVLAHHLLKAIEPPTRLILVGDPDQLPSVAAGNVLAELLASECLPAYRLRQVFRQDEDSLIVSNAHRVLRGEMPSFPRTEDADFFFFPADGEEQTAGRLIEVVTERIPRRFGMDWVRDVQVLSPMYRGACGVDALNAGLREALGAGGLEVQHRGRVWRIGDRVIHTRNDYEKEVFNGDMGRIVAVEPEGRLLVRYPERDVPYEPNEIQDLQPAFAITVHRSQGGEFPAVVMPLVTQHYTMLQRHLFYTAMTRARRLVVLVGSLRALRMAVENAEQRERLSLLGRRLQVAGPG